MSLLTVIATIWAGLVAAWCREWVLAALCFTASLSVYMEYKQFAEGDDTTDQ